MIPRVAIKAPMIAVGKAFSRKKRNANRRASGTSIVEMSTTFVTSVSIRAMKKKAGVKTPPKRIKINAHIQDLQGILLSALNFQAFR